MDFLLVKHLTIIFITPFRSLLELKLNLIYYSSKYEHHASFIAILPLVGILITKWLC
jgi:hypothetical protein